METKGWIAWQTIQVLHISFIHFFKITQDSFTSLQIMADLTNPLIFA